MNLRSDFTYLIEYSNEKDQKLLNKKKKKLGQKEKNNLISKYFQPDNKKKEDIIIKEISNNLSELDLKGKNPAKSTYKNSKIHDYIKKMKQNDNTSNDCNMNVFRYEDSNNSFLINNLVTDKSNSTFCVDKFQIHSKNPITSKFNDNNICTINPQNNVNKTIFKPITSDYKITDWVIYKSYDSWRNIPMEIFHEIFKFLKLKDICRCSSTCKEWHVFYKNIFTSYNFFSVINSQDYKTNEFKKLLQKGKPLKHISILNEIIKKDFGNHSENLTKGIVIQLKHSKDYNSNQNFILESFKVKPKSSYLNNFLSNASVEKVCNSSKYSLKELSLIGCYRLTEKIADSLSELIALEKLDLSMSDNLNENCLKIIFESCINLKTLCLKGLKVVGDQTIISISSNLKALEALDISDTNVKGESLFKLSGCTNLKILLMKNLLMKDNDIQCLLKENNNIITISLSGCNSLSCGILDIICQFSTKIKNLELTNLNCLNEDKLYNFIKSQKTLEKIAIDKNHTSLRLGSIKVPKIIFI